MVAAPPMVDPHMEVMEDRLMAAPLMEEAVMVVLLNFCTPKPIFPFARALGPINGDETYVACPSPVP